MPATWSVENVATDSQVRICYGDLCTEMPYSQATKFAQRILGFTGSLPPNGRTAGATSRSMKAAGGKKGGKRGGKAC